jgi:hypothetical protein
MPCLHRFCKWLSLPDDKIDWQVKTLIVGTFNPAWTGNNEAAWFYGRTSNNYFWEVLPRLYGLPSLLKATPTEWKAFCRANHIGLTDLISSVEDADENNTEHVKIISTFSDAGLVTHFNKFAWTDIAAVLDQHPAVTNIYLTRSASRGI